MACTDVRTPKRQGRKQSSDFQRCRRTNLMQDAEFLNLIFESNHTTVVSAITKGFGLAHKYRRSTSAACAIGHPSATFSFAIRYEPKPYYNKTISHIDVVTPKIPTCSTNYNKQYYITTSPEINQTNNLITTTTTG